ncbi:P-loop containing nucleoside triphosphate hydrolase protein [Hesseltinella vesiculosa]|uniref:P-loop containing nucleoside triphosphate hydrolase protein n=1 Tax=Hesseltinella vesiculosa TaxID=101127 RepID=A0A1X2GNB9_9FUNG|nr:P-loop containing nucleoside triphosphate hydrolase protein [Hesseltinella vesiculosa]
MTMDSNIRDIQNATAEFLEDVDVSQSTIGAFFSKLGEKIDVPAPITDKGTTSKDLAAVVNDDLLCQSSVTSEHKPNDSGKKVSKRVMRRNRKRQEDAPAQGNDNPPPTISAISQQSRFHSETLETLSKDIDLKQVNISVNDQQLLVDAHLRLKEDVHYGLVGPNGAGKSVLMKCLGENLLIGLPQNITILHVDQLETQQGVTVMDEILSADTESVQIMKEYELINKVIQASEPSTKEDDIQRAVHQLLVDRSSAHLEDLQAIAIKRSGARGWDARNELVDAEAKHMDLVAKNPRDYITPDIVNDTMSDVLTKASLMDREIQIAKASKILTGLGFSNEQLVMKSSVFSGGWRMRIALAKALFVEPNILLLDEPTNHLDLPAILWLREYIICNTSDITVVIVSHDREFLNSVTTETIIFKDKQLKYHVGNFEDYEKNTEEQRIRKQRMLDNQEKKKKQILSSIQNDIQRAKSSGDDKRLGQVASRTKKLDRLGMQKTEDGKRYKVSYRAGFHLKSHVDIVVDQKIKTNAINIPDPTPLRSSGPFLSVERMSFKYEPNGPLVVRNVTFCLEPCSRIVLLGPNGSGKSTILDLITGKLQPTTGVIQSHPLLRIGYFAQHVVDTLNGDLTPVELIKQKDISLSEQDCYAHLGSVGMGAYGTKPIKHLSGGQRSRVVLALITMDQPQVLILDEITNHLDMGTVDILVQALDAYTGSLILVSHDIWFLKQLVESEFDDDVDEDKRMGKTLKTHVYDITSGQFKPWLKSLDAYVSQTLKNVKRGMKNTV